MSVKAHSKGLSLTAVMELAHRGPGKAVAPPGIRAPGLKSGVGSDICHRGEEKAIPGGASGCRRRLMGRKQGDRR